MRHPNNIIFKTEKDAYDALGHMNAMIRQYGQVSLAALIDLNELEPIYEECCYGWLNLNEANVVKTEEGYILSMPPMEEFEIGDEDHVTMTFWEKNKKKIIIAGVSMASTAALYFAGRAFNRSELGCKAKKKFIYRLIDSQIHSNKSEFVAYYAVNSDHYPEELIGKIGDAITKIAETYGIVLKDI